MNPHIKLSSSHKILALVAGVIFMAVVLLSIAVLIIEPSVKNNKIHDSSWTADSLHKDKGYISYRGPYQPSEVFIGSKISSYPKKNSKIHNSWDFSECFPVPIKDDTLIVSRSCTIPNGGVYFTDRKTDAYEPQGEYIPPQPAGFIHSPRGNVRFITLDKKHYRGVVKGFSIAKNFKSVKLGESSLFAFTPQRMATNIIPLNYINNSTMSVNTTLTALEQGAPVFNRNSDFIGFFYTFVDSRVNTIQHVQKVNLPQMK